MKIGFDATGILGQGGIDRYAREVMRHVVKLDTVNEYIVLTRTSKENDIRAIVKDGHHIELRNGYPHDMMLGPLFSLVTRQLQTRVWKRKMSDVDLVHLTNHWRWRPPMKRHVVTVHDMFPLTMTDISDAKIRKVYSGYLDALVPDAAMILTPSDFVAATIAERYPKKADVIRATPLAASAVFEPTPMSAELRARVGLREDERYLVFIGRIDDRKNLVRMIEAFLSIPTAQREGVRFVLGLSGVRESITLFMKQQAALLANEAIRPFFGLSTPDIVMLLSEARALAFASIAEGFGLPVLEAMQCGCPVLTANITSMPEVTGDAAILVDPYDVDAIRNAMIRLIADDSLVADLKVRGLERARYFSWENTARLTLQAYEEAMS